jgi:uncharacterized protein YjbI with pentapeptide repeats
MSKVFYDETFNEMRYDADDEFIGGIIEFCEYHYCKFVGVDFSGVNFVSSKFNECTFQDCIFYNSKISGKCNFSGCFFGGCDFKEGVVLNSLFVDCDLISCDFRSRRFEMTSFQDCKVVACSFESVIMRQSMFTGGSFRDSDVTGIYIDNVSRNLFNKVKFDPQNIVGYGRMEIVKR